MSNFLTTDQWQEFCYLSAGNFVDFESNVWKALNIAVRNYIGNQSDQQRVALKKAMEDFLKAKAGRDSKRNKFGIIEAIYKYINDPKLFCISAPLKGANTADFLSPYLSRAKIGYKPGEDKKWKDSIGKVCKQAKKELKSHLTTSKEDSTPTKQEESTDQKSAESKKGGGNSQLLVSVKEAIKKQINDILTQLKEQFESQVDISTLTEKISENFFKLMVEELKNDLESMIPYFGLAKEGSKAVKGIISTATNVVKHNKFSSGVVFMDSSNRDVTACLGAVDVLLKQIIAEKAAQAAVSSANFAFGVAAAVGTGGIDIASTVTGAASITLKFFYLVGGFVATYFAMEDANLLLEKGDLKSIREAINKFPLLGAHVIVNLYPTESDFANYGSVKDVFIFFDIEDQSKPPFDEPLLQLYYLKTKSIKESATAILNKSHFRVELAQQITKKPEKDWQRGLNIYLRKRGFFYMALIIAENFSLYEHVEKALKKYLGEIGGGSGFLGYRILGGGGNKNILGVSWQSQESEKAVALLDAIIKIDNISTKQIAEIVSYQKTLNCTHLLLASYNAEAEQFVDYKQTSTYKRFEECKENSFALLRIVQYLLGFPLEDEYQLNVNDETLRGLNKSELPVRLKIKSRFQIMLLFEYQQWVRKIVSGRAELNCKDFSVVTRILPT